MATKDELIGLYIATDDEISRIERVNIAPLKKRLEDIKTVLGTKLTADGENSSSCTTGTAYYEEGDAASLGDADEFFNFVIANEAWDLIEKRVAKLSIRGYIEEHKTPPPGVNYTTYRKLKIRRPTAK